MSSGGAKRTGTLIIAPNWLGDLVMTTPLLDVLRRTDGLGVHVLVRDLWRPLLEHDPRLDSLTTYERNGCHAGISGALRLAGLVRAGHYEEAYVLPPSFRAAAVAALAGIPRRVGWTGEGRRALLTDPVIRGPRGHRHLCAKIVDLCTSQPLVADTGALPSLPAADRWPADRRLTAGRPHVALAVGATYGDAKSWPPALAARFARACAGTGRRVLVLGDAAARGHAEELGRHLEGGWISSDDDGAGVVDLVGSTRMLEVGALLRDVDLFVGNDSGLMHLAAALGTPTLGLFGSTNPDWTSPRGLRTAVLRAVGFSCSPCHLRECPQPEFCLDSIKPEAVLEAAEQLIGGGKP